MLYAIVAVLVIILDQWVKYWVANSVSMSSTGEKFLPGLISLVNLHNDGAAFSFLSGGGARIYFIILTGAFAVAVIIALATNFISGRFARWCLVLVAAGGMSNCIDRVIYGYVQDMFKTEFINFPIFNVADVFITVFCILFVIAVLFEKKKPNDDDDFLDDEEEEYKPRRKARKPADEEDYDEAPRRSAQRRAPAAEAERPVRKARPAAAQEGQPVRRPRSAQSAAAPAQRPARPARPAQQTQAADPFADWDQANARVEAQRKATAQSRGAAVPAASAQAPQRPAAAQRPAQQAQRPAAQPADRPAQPAAPKAAAAPAPKPAPKAAAEEEFSLDDILAEFK